MAVTATPEQQRALLDVQALDTSLLQVAHKRGSIPETAMVRELEVELGSIDMRIVAATTEMSDRTLDLRKAESDVEQVVNRAKRDREGRGGQQSQRLCVCHRRSMEQPMGSVSVTFTGTPRPIASSASRTSCTVAARRARPMSR